MEVETSRSSPPEHSPSADQGAPRATPADAHAKAPPAAVSAPDSSTAGTKGRLAETGCAAVAAPGASAQQLAPMGSGEPATESSESDGDQPRSRSPPVSPLADPLSETPCTAAAVGDTRNGKRKRPATAAPDHLEQQPPGGAAAQPGSVATSAHSDVGTSTAEGHFPSGQMPRVVQSPSGGSEHFAGLGTRPAQRAALDEVQFWELRAHVFGASVRQDGLLRSVPAMAGGVAISLVPGIDHVHSLRHLPNRRFPFCFAEILAVPAQGSGAA